MIKKKLSFRFHRGVLTKAVSELSVQAGARGWRIALADLYLAECHSWVAQELEDCYNILEFETEEEAQEYLAWMMLNG